MIRFFLVSFCFFFLANLSQQAEAAFVVPRLTGPVVDQARIFRNQDVEAIEKWLEEIKARGKVQIQVVTLESLQDLSIEEASIHIADAWKIGGAKTDTGLIFVIAPKERKIRLEVGQGLEGDLPDVFAKRIVSDVISPYFHKGEYEQGIIAGITAALSKVDPGALNEQDAYNDVSAKRKAGALGLRLIILLVILVFILSLGGGGPRNGFLIGLLSGFAGGRGFGGGSFGGGGWSGGGGGFSGGGASGDW